MDDARPITVEGRDGLRGTLRRPPAAPDREVELALDTGQSVLIDASALIPRPDGSYFLPLSPADVAAAADRQTVTIPVMREDVHIDKHEISRGNVTVHVSPRVRQETVDVTLGEDQVDVQRIPVNRIVEAPAPPREENGTTVIPVYEEVLVVEKRLRLKEEIRVTRRRTTRPHREDVSLRSEEVEIIREQNS